MALTKDEVLNVAKLARLEFNTKEIEKYQEELNAILNYIDMLNEIDVSETQILSQVNNDINNLKDDDVKPSLFVEDALSNAPESIDGELIVPKIMGD